MENIKQLSPYGRRVLIITSILSLGLIWILYLSMYGFYEIAFLRLKKRNEGVKNRSSTYAKVSQVSYWVFFIIAPMMWYSTKLVNEFNDLNFDGALYPGLGQVLSYYTVIVSIFFTCLFIIGLYISAFPMVQLGLKLMFYPRYDVTKSCNVLIVFGTILTLGINWVVFLIVYGIHNLVLKLYCMEQSQHKNWTIFGIMSLVMYVIYLIYITYNYTSTQEIQDLVYVIAVLIGSVSLYGLLQVTIIQVNKTLKVVESN